MKVVLDSEGEESANEEKEDSPDEGGVGRLGNSFFFAKEFGCRGLHDSIANHPSGHESTGG